MALAARDPVLEVLAMTDTPVEFCNWCPVPTSPDLCFHPDGLAQHRELFGLPVSVLTDREKRTLLLGLEVLGDLRKANRMDPAKVDALHRRLESEWFGEAPG